jgi:hypothetical protein
MANFISGRSQSENVVYFLDKRVCERVGARIKSEKAVLITLKYCTDGKSESPCFAENNNLITKRNSENCLKGSTSPSSFVRESIVVWSHSVAEAGRIKSYMDGMVSFFI